MSDDVTHEEIYEAILSQLEKRGGSEVASTIRITVARGIVRDADDRSATKTLRPMDGRESLAVALEQIVSFLEVPLMIETVKRTFEKSEVQWKPEETDMSAKSASLPSVDLRAQTELQKALQEVVGMAAQLKIALPEIA